MKAIVAAERKAYGKQNRRNETLQFLRKKLAENGSLRNMLQLLEELEETAQEGR